MTSYKIEIIDAEELFLLHSFKGFLKSSSPDSSLFLVGDWTRSKMFQTKSFNYELVCYWQDYERFKRMISELLKSSDAQKYFETSPFLRKKNSKKKKRTTDSATVRFYSHHGNKFKISLEALKNNSLADDLLIRDFTINALYFDIKLHKVIQFRNCINDFGDRMLRTLKSPLDTFENQINLFFRLVEFVTRYELKIDPDIIEYFFSISTKANAIQPAVFRCISNFNSSSKKFFSKHYVAKMLKLLLELHITDLFRLGFKDPFLFKRIFAQTVLFMERVEVILETDFLELMAREYPKDSRPKIFSTKTRIFMFAFSFYRFDKIYVNDFLKMFLYTNKPISSKCIQLLDRLHFLIQDFNYKDTRSKQSKIAQAVSYIRECDFDKSKWGLLFVFKVCLDFEMQRKEKENHQ